MNEFSTHKKKWWNGFRDANTGDVFNGFDIGVSEYGIPRTFDRVNLNDCDPKSEKQLRVMNYMWDMCNDPHAHRTMVVTGGNGTGKTFMGCGLIHAVALLDCVNASRFHDPRYVYEGMLLRSVSGFNSDNAFNFWTNRCGVLVLDEFGMTQWTPSDKRTIEQILNIRFSNDLPTVVLTNRTAREIFGPVEQGEPLFSSQLRSRYRSGYLIELTGPDLRNYSPVDQEEDDDESDPF